MDPLMTEPILDLGRGELRVTLIVCAISLVAVWIPLARGTLLCWRARRATALPRGAHAETSFGVAALTRAVADSASQQLDDEPSLPFVRDAAKQLVIDDYETSFAQPILSLIHI